MKTVEEVIDPGKGVFLLHRDMVQSTVIHTEAEGPIFFLDENYRGTER